jgi:hypothetical protein
MSEGFLRDHTYGASMVTEWVAGPPERSLWGGVKTGDRTHLRVTVYRCDLCGYLESYAKAV